MPLYFASQGGDTGHKLRCNPIIIFSISQEYSFTISEHALLHPLEHSFLIVLRWFRRHAGITLELMLVEGNTPIFFKMLYQVPDI